MSQNNQELTKTAKGYIASFLNGDEFPGGFGYRKQLDDCQLDFSMASLKRIDALLDLIRVNDQPAFTTFIEKNANQHFLHLIAFYVGYVAGKNIGMEPEWYSREQAIALIPQLQHLWPEDLFETSIICMFRIPGQGSQQFPPMLSVTTRLFTGEKSVWASASGIKFATEKNKAAPPPEGLFMKFRRILNSL